MASLSGVLPDLLELLGLTSFRSNSSLTVHSWPFSVAHASGVWPYCSYEWPIEKYERESKRRKSEVKEEPVDSEDSIFLVYRSI